MTWKTAMIGPLMLAVLIPALLRCEVPAVTSGKEGRIALAVGLLMIPFFAGLAWAARGLRSSGERVPLSRWGRAFSFLALSFLGAFFLLVVLGRRDLGGVAFGAFMVPCFLATLIQLRLSTARR